MKYIDVEKLIAEIERLKKEARKNALIAQDNNTSVCAFWSGKEHICAEILDIINHLQQGQLGADLEKEIDACWQNWLSPSNQKEIEGILPKTEFAMYARHFYELGLNARKEE